MRLGIATSAKCPHLIPAEQTLMAQLSGNGITSTPAIWNNPTSDWGAFDAVLVRSIWDYHLHPDAFLSWLSRLDALKIPVWNPVDVLRWNYHKFYLRDLAGKGIDIVPTLFMQGGSNALDQVKTQGWEKIVVKPAVSASSYRTHSVITVDSAGILADASAHGDFLVQSFMPEIGREGEISLIYFNQEFSHAVLKRPAAGEFRVQKELGGHEVPWSPPEAMKKIGGKILGLVGHQVLYARVDGVISDGRFLLMELELIEPDLFLTTAEGAIERFAKSLS